VSTGIILACHFGAAIVIYLGFFLRSLRGSGIAPRPRDSPTAGAIGLEGVVTRSEPELVAPCSRRASVAWRLMMQGDEGVWHYGPSDWAEAIVLRLDTGGEVRLLLPDFTFTSGLQCVATISEEFDPGERPPRVGRIDHLRGGLGREESIGIGDRVYVSGTFSQESAAVDDPMRREGEAVTPQTWAVRTVAGARPVRLHRGGFADFGPFGSRSLHRYRAALSITIPAFALYLLIALMVFGRLW